MKVLDDLKFPPGFFYGKPIVDGPFIRPHYLGYEFEGHLIKIALMENLVTQEILNEFVSFVLKKKFLENLNIKD